MKKHFAFIAVFVFFFASIAFSAQVFRETWDGADNWTTGAGSGATVDMDEDSTTVGDPAAWSDECLEIIHPGTAVTAYAYKDLGSNKTATYSVYEMVIKAEGFNSTNHNFSATTADGYVTASGADWSTVILATSGTADTTSNTSSARSRYLTGTYYCDRAFMGFDTSSIPDNASLHWGRLRLWASASVGGADPEAYLAAFQWTDGPVVDNGDYDDYGTQLSSSADYLDLSDVEDTQFNHIKFTNTSAINKTGSTYLCLREGHDIEAVAPTSNNSFTFYSANKGTDIAQLEVMYTTKTLLAFAFSTAGNPPTGIAWAVYLAEDSYGDRRLEMHSYHDGAKNVYLSDHTLNLDDTYRWGVKWDADNDKWGWRINGIDQPNDQDSAYPIETEGSLTGSHVAYIRVVGCGDIGTLDTPDGSYSVYFGPVEVDDADWPIRQDVLLSDYTNMTTLYLQGSGTGSTPNAVTTIRVCPTSNPVVYGNFLVNGKTYHYYYPFTIENHYAANLTNYPMDVKINTHWMKAVGLLHNDADGDEAEIALESAPLTGIAYCHDYSEFDLEDTSYFFNTTITQGQTLAYRYYFEPTISTKSSNYGTITDYLSISTYNYQVGASTDDARYWVLGYSNTGLMGGAGDWSGSTDEMSGYRFLNVGTDVPDVGDYIEAYVTLTSYGNYSNQTIRSRFYCENNDTPATFGTDASDFTGRIRTAEYKQYDGTDVGSWTTDTEYSFDISPVIRPLFQRNDWGSGDDAVVFWQEDVDNPSSDNAFRFAYHYDDTPAKAAKLTVKRGTLLGNRFQCPTVKTPALFLADVYFENICNHFPMDVAITDVNDTRLYFDIPEESEINTTMWGVEFKVRKTVGQNELVPIKIYFGSKQNWFSKYKDPSQVYSPDSTHYYTSCDSTSGWTTVAGNLTTQYQQKPMNKSGYYRWTRNMFPAKVDGKWRSVYVGSKGMSSKWKLPWEVNLAESSNLRTWIDLGQVYDDRDSWLSPKTTFYAGDVRWDDSSSVFRICYSNTGGSDDSAFGMASDADLLKDWTKSSNNPIYNEVEDHTPADTWLSDASWNYEDGQHYINFGGSLGDMYWASCSTWDGQYTYGGVNWDIATYLESHTIAPFDKHLQKWWAYAGGPAGGQYVYHARADHLDETFTSLGQIFGREYVWNAQQTGTPKIWKDQGYLYMFCFGSPLSANTYWDNNIGCWTSINYANWTPFNYDSMFRQTLTSGDNLFYENSQSARGNIEITVDVLFTGGDQSVAIVLRMLDSNDYYKALLKSTRNGEEDLIALILVDDGVETTLEEHYLPVSTLIRNGYIYQLRVQSYGNNLKVLLCPYGNEWTTWIDLDDSTQPTTGYVGLYCDNEVYVDNFTVGPHIIPPIQVLGEIVLPIISTKGVHSVIAGGQIGR